MILELIDKRQEQFNLQTQQMSSTLSSISPLEVSGKLTQSVGTVITAHVPDVKIGDLCLITDIKHGINMYAEVVTIHNSEAKLLPYGDTRGLSNNCLVRKYSDGFKITLNDSVLGSVLDGFGNTVRRLHGEESKKFSYSYDIKRAAPDPMERPIIVDKLLTGVKCIDLFNTCGCGQRVAIFAAPGIGKTTLMGMILRNIDADVIVVGLIGERGREINEFIELELGSEVFHKLVIVASTSDKPPIELVKSAYVAQTIAEHFRDQGKKVVLFIDSITRFARAGREIGLSSGEPATRGGYPPSVFLSFPALMERAGNNKHGSITAFYTVLLEGDKLEEDPIAGEIKSIVDGHIVLSRNLAERGHFPAIDPLKSLSRIGDRLITEPHLLGTRHLKLLLSKFQELEFLLKVGEYKAGNDKLADEAIAKNDRINKLLQQNVKDGAVFDTELKNLLALVKAPK